MKRELLAILFLLSLVGFGCQKAQKDTITVGVVAELTGDMPAVGNSCRNAAQMAVDEMNGAGPIIIAGSKYKVRLLVEDNAGKPEQGVAAAQKLVTQDGAAIIIGPNASRYAIPVGEIAESLKVPMITPWSTNASATINARSGKPKQFVFRACFVDSFQGAVVARFAREQLKAAKAAVLYDVASDYNKGIAEYFRTAFTKLGGEVSAFETYTTNDRDFSAQLTKIRSSNPDMVFLPNYYSEVPLQVQQAHRLGLNVPFLGSDSWGSSDLLNLCGRECEGFYFSTHYAADRASEQAKSFISAYSARYSLPPDDVAALTYDAFGLLRRALAQVREPSPAAIRDALASISDFHGVTGDMKFNPGSGDPLKSAVIVQIKNGAFTWFADAQP